MPMRKQGFILGGAAIALIVGYSVTQNRYAPHDNSMKPPVQTVSVTKLDTLPKAGTAVSVAIPSPKAFTVNIDPVKGGSLNVYRLRKGERAMFAVTSSIDGKLAVHGYTADLPVKAHNELKFDLTAIHTGRFPMHIHGRDGSHLKVGVLEVLPD